MNRVAIVILNYNGKSFLEKFLPTVIALSKGHDVIVVDNGSDDESVAYLKSSFSDIRLIELSKNLGYTGGYNEAIKIIENEFICCLNSDIEVTPNWVDPILELMQANPQIAACQPKLLSYNKKSDFEYAGAAGGFIDLLGFPFCRGRLFNTMETDEGQYDDSRQIFWASGACLFIRRNAFLEAGGFDTDFFAHMEEVDLCWRLQNLGYEIYYNGKSTVYHVGGGTLSKSNPRKTYLNFRNGLSMFVKNESPGSLWWKLPFRAFLDFVAMTKFAIVDSLSDAGAVLKAHIHFWTGLPLTLRKRRALKQHWTPGRKTIIYKGSIVLEYFLSGKRKFSDLNFPGS